MDFSFHPEFAESIDRRLSSLVSQVEDVTERLKHHKGLHTHPDAFIAAKLTDADIVGEARVTQVDVSGRAVGFAFRRGDHVVGLRDDSFHEAMRIAEAIHTHGNLAASVSADTVQQVVLQWVVDTSQGKEPKTVCQLLEQLVRREVLETTIWIPISNLFVESPFAFGNASVRMLTASEVSDALRHAQRNTTAPTPASLTEELRRNWAGQAVMEFKLVAHPHRARELAWNYAETYCALLQFFGAPIHFGPLPSRVAPRGTRPYREEHLINFSDKGFNLSRRIVDPPWVFEITDEMLKHMHERHLAKVSILVREQTCEYEVAALAALLVYCRAAYHGDEADKVLQIITAIEMFALRDQGEPIAKSVGDRLAFAITTAAGKRAQIARNFNDVYKLRSRRTHHGQTLADSEAVAEFLTNAWSFFLVVVRGIGMFKSRKDFLDRLDARKWGQAP